MVRPRSKSKHRFSLTRGHFIAPFLRHDPTLFFETFKQDANVKKQRERERQASLSSERSPVPSAKNGIEDWDGRGLHLDSFC